MKILIVATALVSTAGQAAPVLMRYPTANHDAVAFVARGEVWIAAQNGGRARQLTRGDGYALATRFSPDGTRIAYTRRIAGGQDVWVVPAAGGTAVRLTHDASPQSSGNLVLGWTPDGGKVLFLSQRQAVARGQTRAFAVPVTGGLAERLPIDQTGLVDISRTDGRIAYTPTYTEAALRKRYLGGEAEDVFVYDPKTHARQRITDWRGTDGFPMWTSGAIYFLSDRGPAFRRNVWRHDLATGTERQVTRFTDHDIDWPSMGDGRIVFQQGGKLWALDLATEGLTALSIEVPDDGTLTAPRRIAVGDQARVTDVGGAVNYAVAPDGSAALIAARGDVFHVAVAGGEAIDLTATVDRDEDHPVYAPGGRTIAYVTEAGGSGQVAVRPAAGGAPHVLTRFVDAVPYAPVFAPDGRRLAVPDAQHRLWLVSLDGGAATLVARDPLADIRDPAFSPDGAWLAYSMMRPFGLRALHLHRLADGRDIIVSGDLDGDRLPAFSSDGRSLYFVSQRHDYVATGDRGDEATLATIASDGIYAAVIGDDPATLMRRVTEVPVAPGRITALLTRGDALFYERRPIAWIGGDLPGDGELHRVTSEGDEVVLHDFDGQTLAADGRHVLYTRDDAWHVATIGGDDRVLDTGAMQMRVDPRAEWRTMVDQAWRLDRDLFFSRVMNGNDWGAVRTAYDRLVPLIASRDDARYVVGQVQGELATSHSFMGGLDADAPVTTRSASRLGADLVLDEANGRYRFRKIYRGDPSRSRFRAPLNDPKHGVRVADGDYLLAVGGTPLRAPADPDALLNANKGSISLTIAPTPDDPGRTVRVDLLFSELDLRQYDWVEANRARVAAMSGGRIGYVFLSDFASDGAQDLARQLQGQLDRDGLVIDLRWNGGGYTSQAVLNLLRRIRAGVFVNRDRATTSLPLVVAPPAMAVIVNAESASDGDQFPFFFRRFGLGTVVGQRTWGGVQGIKGPWPLIDGTTITVPKDSLAVDGRWVIENYGTEPDIPVDPSPDEIARGQDSMIEAAVRDVLARMPPRRLGERVPPALPAYPAEGNVPGANVGLTKRKRERSSGR